MIGWCRDSIRQQVFDRRGGEDSNRPALEVLRVRLFDSLHGGGGEGPETRLEEAQHGLSVLLKTLLKTLLKPTLLTPRERVLLHGHGVLFHLVPHGDADGFEEGVGVVDWTDAVKVADQEQQDLRASIGGEHGSDETDGVE